MLSTFVRRSFVAAVLATGAFSAQAELVSAGSGSTVDFYYDDAVWAGKTFSVSGDRITFSNVGLRADSSNFGFADYAAASGIPGLVVVAKNGYSFNNSPFSFVTDFTGNFLSTAADGNFVAAESTASVAYGGLVGKTFTEQGTLGESSAEASAEGAANGAWAAAKDALHATAPTGDALALFNISYYALALFDDAMFAEINSIAYSISAAPVVAAVPEPGTLALLAAALGMAGFVRRRSRHDNA